VSHPRAGVDSVLGCSVACAAWSAVKVTVCTALVCAKLSREEACSGTSVLPWKPIGGMRSLTEVAMGWARLRSPCTVPWWLTGTWLGSMMFSTRVV